MRRPGPVTRGGVASTVVTLAAVTAILVVGLPVAGLLRRVRWSDLPADLTTPAALEAIRLSLVCSLGAAVASVALGLPLAWALARWPMPGRAAIRALVLVPLVLPPVVGGVALLAAFSRRGVVGGWLHDTFGVQLTFSVWGAVLAQTFVALPFFVIIAEAALRPFDRRYERAAATLGASPTVVSRRITLRMLAPSLLAGAVLAWARALGEFGATITFAGNVESRTRTVPLAVYLALQDRPQVAIALSAAMLVVSVTVIAALRDRWFRTA